VNRGRFFAVMFGTAIAIVVVVASLFWFSGGSAAVSEQKTTNVGWQARGYLLTKMKVNGKQALAACPSGYHMANMAEIVSPSSLKYDTSNGFTYPDSGSGPPFATEGWVRTGLPSWPIGTGSPTSGGGVANCRVWTSDAAEDSGSVVMLVGGWGANVGSIDAGPMKNNIYTPTVIAPWRTRPVGRTGSNDAFAPSQCSESYGVWCVQN
jgi:hypothetical protein